MKATKREEVTKFTDIPNIGPAVEKKLRQLKIASPKYLAKLDAYNLYQQLNEGSGVRHDPCLLDTFIAAVDFMQGAPPRPWHYYTRDRKKRYPNL